MKVLLQTDLDNLGKAGEIVNVKDGYARNYLIPRKYAVLADEKNVRTFEHLKRQTDEKIRKMRKASEALAEKLAAVSLVIPCKVGEEGKLFGAVTAIQIAEELKKLGHDVDRRKISLDHPFKQVGEYEVKVKIDAVVSAAVKVSVVAEQ